MFICVFSYPISIVDSNVAELLPIEKALSILAPHRDIWSLMHDVLMESNSIVAVSWVSPQDKYLWRFSQCTILSLANLKSSLDFVFNMLIER